MGVFTLQGIGVNLTVTEQTCSHCHDKFRPAYLRAQATLFFFLGGGEQVRGVRLHEPSFRFRKTQMCIRGALNVSTTL